MARKSLGFVPLIWECPFCNTQNPGPIKSCTSCGAPQPEDVEFLQVDEEKFNFIKDEALIRMAKAGPDIHCPYCGTRNPGTAKLCSKCGGELSLGGKARATGARVRTISEASAKEQPPVSTPAPPIPQTSPSVSAPRKKLSPILIVIPILVIIACLIGAYFLFFKSEDLDATVTGVEWERSIVVEAYRESTTSDWWDQIPDDAEILGCSEEYRYSSDEWEPNSTEVCGEAYVEDTGTVWARWCRTAPMRFTTSIVNIRSWPGSKSGLKRRAALICPPSGRLSTWLPMSEPVPKPKPTALSSQPASVITPTPLLIWACSWKPPQAANG